MIVMDFQQGICRFVESYRHDLAYKSHIGMPQWLGESPCNICFFLRIPITIFFQIRGRDFSSALNHIHDYLWMGRRVLSIKLGGTLPTLLIMQYYSLFKNELKLSLFWHTFGEFDVDAFA